MRIEYNTPKTSFGLNAEIISKTPITKKVAIDIGLANNLGDSWASNAYSLEGDGILEGKHWAFLDLNTEDGAVTDILIKGIEIRKNKLKKIISTDENIPNIASQKEEIKLGEQNIKKLIIKIFGNKESKKIYYESDK